MAVDYASATLEYGATPETLTLLEFMKRITGADDTVDDEYTLYLQLAGEAAESFADNKLVRQEASERFPLVNTPISLRYDPVESITSVTIDGDDVTTDWSLYSSDGVYYAENGFDAGDPFKQLVITYSAGYDPLPADVGYAIVKVAITISENAAAPSSGIKKEVINGVGSVEYLTPADVSGSDVGLLSPATVGTLMRYRRLNA